MGQYNKALVAFFTVLLAELVRVMNEGGEVMEPRVWVIGLLQASIATLAVYQVPNIKNGENVLK